MNRIRFAVPVFLAALAPTWLPAQTPIRDFTPSTGSVFGSHPGPMTALNGIGYFGATDEFGVELWRTDGTTAGTWRVKDVNPGTANSDPGQFVAVGNQLFFTATVAGLGRELWVTDGTAAGTHLVLDINPQRDIGASVTSPVAFGGKLFFVATNLTNGTELWVSDGTVAGTHVLVDLVPGAGAAIPNDLVVWNGSLWFTALTSVNGQEIWRTDGTVAGTVLAIELAAGSNSLYVQNLTPAGNLMYFRSEERRVGKECRARWAP